MSKRYLFTAVVFILWIVGFYLATGFSGEDLIGDIFKINPLNFLVGYGFYLLAVGTGTLTLYLSLKRVGLKVPLWGVGKAWIFGSFLDNIVPTITPIGEASMAYFMEKFYRVSYSKSLAAVGMYVSSWAISVSVFSIIAIIITQCTIGLGVYLIPVMGVVILFSLITMGWLLLLAKRDLVERISSKIVIWAYGLKNKLLKKKISIDKAVFAVEFERSYASLKLVMKNKKHILSYVFLLGLPQIAHVFCIYFIALGFGVNISFFAVLLIHIVASVAGLLSFIPSGLVVHEITTIGLLVSFGVPNNIAAAIELLYRIIFVWTTNLIGGLVGMVSGIKDVEDIKHI